MADEEKKKKGLGGYFNAHNHTSSCSCRCNGGNHHALRNEFDTKKVADNHDDTNGD